MRGFEGESRDVVSGIEVMVMVGGCATSCGAHLLCYGQRTACVIFNSHLARSPESTYSCQSWVAGDRMYSTGRTDRTFAIPNRGEKKNQELSIDIRPARCMMS
jgi:hypothetical protein